MDAGNNNELAGMLAELSKKGFSIFAHYDVTVHEEIFKGICIYPKNKEAKQFLEQTAELIMVQKGLGSTKSKKNTNNSLV